MQIYSSENLLRFIFRNFLYIRIGRINYCVPNLIRIEKGIFQKIGIAHSIVRYLVMLNGSGCCLGYFRTVCGHHFRTVRIAVFVGAVYKFKRSSERITHSNIRNIFIFGIKYAVSCASRVIFIICNACFIARRCAKKEIILPVFFIINHFGRPSIGI